MSVMSHSEENARYVIGVDVGGTFTDLFILDQETGEVVTGKVPSTIDDQSRGLVEGILRERVAFSEIATIVHGTTVGTNALLERRGSKTGLITTAGFEDVLEMRRRDRPQTWGLRGSYQPVIERDLRLGVRERTLASGEIETILNEADVITALKRLQDAGCDSLCIAFINAYANPANELAAKDCVRAHWHNDHITVSCDILPEIREFERVSTSVLNAYLQPKMAHYLGQLKDRLGDKGFAGDLLIVQSNGGVMDVASAGSQPIRTALSGPAAGVMAAKFIGKSAGFENIITCDMGGTSFDVSLIAEGQSSLAAQASIDFGMVVRSPMIEMTTIGAGGGSIAWIDKAGILQIGPRSAGSNPGPVCYGLGNDEPTVTDANLLMGRINANRPIGGKLSHLDVDAARASIRTKIAAPLGISDLEAAEAIIQVANAKMAGAIRIVSIERGHDPEKFVAMPFGGGGALHIGALIKEVGLQAGLVPRFPGVTSALGCVISDMRHDALRTVNIPLSTLDESEALGWIEALWDKCYGRMSQSGQTRFERITEEIEADMLYLGQTHTVKVSVRTRGELTREGLLNAFERAYRRQIGQPLENVPIQIVNLRVAAIGHRAQLDLSALAPKSGQTAEQALIETRQVWSEGEWHSTPIYNRLALGVAECIKGPAILEQPDTTIFLEPDLMAKVDENGNLIVTRKI